MKFYKTDKSLLPGSSLQELIRLARKEYHQIQKGLQEESLMYVQDILPKTKFLLITFGNTSTKNHQKNG